MNVDEISAHRRRPTLGLEKKVFGSGLKELVPAAEWVVAARKEALWLSFRARSKRELLDRLTRNKYGSVWFIDVADAEPRPLVGWLAIQDAETAKLLAADAADAKKAD